MIMRILRYSGSHVAFAVLGPDGLTGLVYGAASGNVGGESPRLMAGAWVAPWWPRCSPPPGSPASADATSTESRYIG
jgi:hypothetical protein